jgi:hypothetical protein
MKPTCDGYLFLKAESKRMFATFAKELTVVSVFQPPNLDCICE